MRRTRAHNPFSITKAVDLDDEQIENLWVSMVSDENSLEELDHPASPMPTFILGAKGSGKTHLMRHQAYELQRLRHKRAGVSPQDGIFQDGYLGLYVRCSGLQSSRFSGKRQSTEIWDDLFSYYFELWLAQHLLYVAIDLDLDNDPAVPVSETVEAIESLFDYPLALDERSLAGIVRALTVLQRQLDYEINNCLLKGGIDVKIVATRGKLIFGIPKILSIRYEFLRDVLFAYDVDEFENLTESQQVHVNTLVREKEPPTTFRIGSRTYGVKTLRTNSAGEENQVDSEFSQISLDMQAREHKNQYVTFARSLLSKRLPEAPHATAVDVNVDMLSGHFDKFDGSWDNTAWAKVLGPKYDRPHLGRLTQILAAQRASNRAIEQVVALIQDPKFPVLEKLNIFLLFQELSKGTELLEGAQEVWRRAKLFHEKPNLPSAYRQSIQHHSEDMAAQILRESSKPQVYSGVDTFIQMSSGIPRALLTILRSVFEWSTFNGESPFEGGTISLESQRKGVIAASDWYFNNMRKAGDDGILIQGAIERLANLFRTIRYGDKPTEISLTSFHVVEQDVSEKARRIMKLAEERAFLHRVVGGQKDKNSDGITAKFQLSPMLAPRWELPLIRRNVAKFSVDEVNAIFDIDRSKEYEAMLRKYKARVTAPFKDDGFSVHEQIGLFD